MDLADFIIGYGIPVSYFALFDVMVKEELLFNSFTNALRSIFGERS